MDTISPADTLRLLALIKGFHGQQDLGQGTGTAWFMAFKHAGVRNYADAEAAIVAHYSTPGCNPWITPGDVVGHYKAIRAKRCEGIDFEDLNEDIDPDDTQAWLATGRHRLKAIADGMPKAQALELPPPPEAVHAAIEQGKARPALMRRSS